jgi:hypothetical protein
MVSGLSLPEWGGQRVKLYLTLLLLLYFYCQNGEAKEPSCI